MKILLVDDSRSATAVFAARLGAFGHDVCLAENGQIALRKFREFAPDLVLMDVEMPVMDGFEATNHIRAFETSQKWAWTPIIFLTASGTTDNFVTAIDAGGDDLIAKNIAEPVLRAKLKAMARVAALRHDLLVANNQMAEDIKRREVAEAELLKRYAELTELNIKLSNVQEQLIQSEKLASVGQLAAGVAHEINTPIGYVHSNIGTLEKYLDNFIETLKTYEAAEPTISAEQLAAIQTQRRKVDIDFLKEDALLLIRESKQGIDRVKKIVQNLKDFSHVDNTLTWQPADLHRGIEATLNLLANEIQGKADVLKEYGSLPEVECLPMQLNQVFVNLLANATYAMGETRGKITIRTGVIGDKVWLEFQDNGSGIPKDIQPKIFDPFFTTKPIGKGAGLGLSLSYGIIQNHHGQIELESEVGKGSCFRITLPIKQATSALPGNTP